MFLSEGFLFSVFIFRINNFELDLRIIRELSSIGNHQQAAHRAVYSSTFTEVQIGRAIIALRIGKKHSIGLVPLLCIFNMRAQYQYHELSKHNYNR
jgi:hypothetical protein